jgi:hypothetical protein
MSFKQERTAKHWSKQDEYYAELPKAPDAEEIYREGPREIELFLDRK